MMRYRPVKRGKAYSRRRRINVKRFAAVTGVAAAAVVAIVLGVHMMGKADDVVDTPQEQPVIQSGEVFHDGVSVAGVDVSGMTMDQARMTLAPVADDMLKTGKVEFTVPVKKEGESSEGSEEGEDAADEESSDSTELQIPETKEQYSMTLEELGATVDVQPVLDEALNYTPGEGQMKDFPLALAANEEEIKRKLDDLAEQEEWGTDPINARYKIETSADEDSLTTHGKPVETENKQGYRINVEGIANTIVQQTKQGEFQPFEAQVEILDAKSATDEIGELHKIASATTSFDPKVLWEKKYNVWKMSKILNGAIFYPGESFSINDTAGDRTEDRGWKVALGIEDGQFTPQAGGGICQVSSTLYNATLKAEMKILKRVPHSIKSTYVKEGLDATISTGGPDFVFENPYDVPLYLIINCDAPGNTITTEIWSTMKRDYSVELWSEKVSDDDEKVPEAEIVVNSELSEFAVNRVRPGQVYEKYQVYKRYVDGDGNVIDGKDRIEVTTSQYYAISPKIEVGPGVPWSQGMTYDQVLSAAKAAAGEHNQTAPPPEDIENPDQGEEEPTDPTKSPEEPSKTPEPNPTKNPDPTKTPPPTKNPDPTEEPSKPPETAPPETAPPEEPVGES